MKSDILNNECIDRSPCLTCERRDMDKNQCINTCEALKAYRNGESWKKGKKVVKIMEETEAEGRQPKCEMPGCDKPVVIRGLCQECYDSWRNGVIEHPRLGVFTRQNVSAKKGTCLIPDCDEPAKARGLCSPHYQAYRKGYIEHPAEGKFTLSQKHHKSKIKTPAHVVKKPKSEANPKKLKRNPGTAFGGPPIKKTVIKSKPYPFPDIVSLDFTNYPEIKAVIFERVDKFLLPAEHIIMSMLACLIVGKKED